MPSSLKSVSTAAGSWPLPATEDDKFDNLGLAAGLASQERRRRAANPKPVLGKKTVDRQDIGSGNNHDPASEKEVQVQAETHDNRPKPRAATARVVNYSLPAAAPTPTTYTASIDRDTEKWKKYTENTKTRDKNTNPNQKPSTETSSDEDEKGGADDQSTKCLPFRRRGDRHGPRKGNKGGWFQKFKMRFFSRKKKNAEEPNPYAAPITPYQQARAQIAQGPVSGEDPNNPPPPYNQSPSFGYSSSVGNSPSIGKSPSFGNSPSVGSTTSRFGDEKYGNQRGYGSTPYDNNASAYSSNKRGPGGYGGLDDDAGKDDLFGSAAGRYQQQQQQSNLTSPNLSQPSPSRYDNDPARSALLGNAQDRYNPFPQAGPQPGAADEYDGYGAPRELTEEEKEELETQAIKDQTNAIRKEGVESTDRSLAISQQAIETARGTLARLGAQGDRLHNTEKNLDAAAAKSRIAEDSTKELKTLNGSMFAIHASNPFTSRKRQEQADNAVLERHRMERETREQTRRDAYAASQGLEQVFMEIERKPQRTLGSQSKAERSKYIFEDDDGEAQQMEEAIDDRVEQIGVNVSALHGLANAMGDELGGQTSLIDRIAEKSDAVDDHVRMNRERLARIR
ncbi:hypothetical protein VMCG_01410 [Cytospora schulzeri]|uniref:t-SNARE coiled-coil homology domain-containing protein n=1 Tax=Cytospora schulzeri TaxID=448051 RepID=A0A423X6P9_9PEZI|nr:hypothetical protein VMCG_01410 [Valsa malicola]